MLGLQFENYTSFDKYTITYKYHCVIDVMIPFDMNSTTSELYDNYKEIKK
jgi:hypothetical protein